MTKNKIIKITQIKSSIGYKDKAKKTLAALGLKKLNHTVKSLSTKKNLTVKKVINQKKKKHTQKKIKIYITYRYCH